MPSEILCVKCGTRNIDFDEKGKLHCFECERKKRDRDEFRNCEDE